MMNTYIMKYKAYILRLNALNYLLCSNIGDIIRERKYVCYLLLAPPLFFYDAWLDNLKGIMFARIIKLNAVLKNKQTKNPLKTS